MGQLSIRRLPLAIVVAFVLMGAMVGGALGAPAAQAERQRITAGDANAVFQAGVGGGWAILQHSKVAKGAPADPSGAAILPFGGSPWDGAHFCAEDWHVILVADIEGGDSSFKRTDAERVVQEVTIDFIVDGITALPTTRTAVKRVPNPEPMGYQAAYYIHQGRIMSPAELSVGSHLLWVMASDPDGLFFSDSITFFIDAPGTGTCT